MFLIWNIVFYFKLSATGRKEKTHNYIIEPAEGLTGIPLRADF